MTGNSKNRMESDVAELLPLSDRDLELRAVAQRKSLD